MSDLNFNPVAPKNMHIDLNSCFATIEQQANPLLRGKPIAVCAYTTPKGCILAPSIEAKRFGVKTGMRVMDGKAICPDLIILASDPWKYRNVHLALRSLLEGYTPNVVPKSIDEFVLEFSNCQLAISSKLKSYQINQLENNWKMENDNWKLKVISQQIKQRIKSEIGEWLTVSIGMASNRFLAKLASGLHKPDGLDEINKDNFLKVYAQLKLTDLPYIKLRNAIRLNGVGIYTLTDFYNSPLWKLKAAFESINGYYWYLRLRGWEIDDFASERKSFGNSYALPVSLSSPEELSPILSKLVTKMSARLRFAGYKARGVHVGVSYRDGTFWHKGVGFDEALSDTCDIFKRAYWILSKIPKTSIVRELSVSCFNLIKSKVLQLSLFEDIVRKENLYDSIDKINRRWGEFVVVPGRMLNAKDLVPDRIAFGQPAETAQKALMMGGINELEEFTLRQ